MDIGFQYINNFLLTLNYLPKNLLRAFYILKEVYTRHINCIYITYSWNFQLLNFLGSRGCLRSSDTNSTPCARAVEIINKSFSPTPSAP